MWGFRVCRVLRAVFDSKPSVDVGISGLQGSKTGEQCSVSYCFAVIVRHGLLPVGQSLSCGIACYHFCSQLSLFN